MDCHWRKVIDEDQFRFWRKPAIGVDLEFVVSNQLIELLKEFKDIFA